MDISPEDKKRIYEEEKARLEAQEKLKAEAQAAATRKMGTGCLVAIAVFIGFIVMISAIGGGDRPDHDPITAFVMSEEFVKRKLKAPDSAKFPSFEDSFVRDLGNGVYEVTAYVDAQNSFGATLRNRFYCKLRHTGGDNWMADSVEILSP